MENWIPSDRYDNLSPLAKGGMGQLLLADDRVSGNKVVIKRPRHDTNMVAVEIVKRFQREQGLSASVSHPHIVDVIEFGSHDNEFFIVTEYIRGSDLRQALKSSDRMDLSEIIRIIEAVCDAVQHLHRHGILHRDLQPGNVLVGDDRQIKITDFGLAAPLTDIGEMTQTEQVLGTADYMSPEQRHRLPVDGRSDQYSIAAMTYEMLTGKRPAGLFSSPSDLRADLPTSLDTVLMRALKSDPDDRFASVEEFCSALTHAATDFRRHRNSRALIASLAFATLIGIPGAFLAMRSQTTGPEMIARQPSSETNPPAAKQGMQSNGFSLSQAIKLAKEAYDEKSPDHRPPTLDSQTAPVDGQVAQSVQQQWADYLGVPVTVQNSIGMEFALIPPGRFLMGSSSEEIEQAIGKLESDKDYWINRFRTEAPKHRVAITHPYYLCTHETRVQDFQAFVAETGFRTWAERNQERVGEDDEVSWISNLYEQTGSCPVTQLTITDCRSFLTWLSDTDQVTYRLPTEAEWEHACRAGSWSRFFFGDSDSEAIRYANAMPHSSKHPDPVRQRLPSPLGLFDIHGNVGEFVADKFDRGFYQQSDNSDDPFCQTGDRTRHLVRGGSARAWPHAMRSGTRHHWPHFKPTLLIGFRAAVEIRPQETLY